MRHRGLVNRLGAARLLAAAMLAGPAAGAPTVTPPHRIVSLNLCADQYVMALADFGQIAALTRFARDREMSAAAVKADSLPFAGGSAEELMALRPDLILVGPGAKAALAARFGRGAPVVTLPPADSYAEIVRQLRTVARAVGQEARGEALIAAIDRRLARVRVDGSRGRTAAYYQRRGYLTGTGTLVDDLMTRTGLVNLAHRLGRSPLSRLSLEELALARPDYLIVEEGSDRIVDQGTEMLHHPVIARIPRLRLKQAWTVCGGLAYVRAAEALAAQVNAARRMRR